MAVDTKSHWRHGAVTASLIVAMVALLVGALVACATPAPLQKQQPAGAMDTRNKAVQQVQSITEISVESNCFGCATGALLSLHRDGRAVFTVTGHARHGTADQRSSGRVTAPEFDALARLLLDQGFFGLAESYEDPAVQDGAWATTRVVRAGQAKQVFRRGDAAPAALLAVEAAVAAAQGRIRFNPQTEPSDPRDRGSGK